MVDKICDKLMFRVRAKMPEVDEERAEVIRYGFELIIGEFPKILLMILLAFILGQLKYFLISAVIICTYRTFSGGIHLKSHIGCFIGTNLLYLGNVYISEFVEFENIYTKIILALAVYVFSMIMIFLYVPADTDTVPILRKKDRRNKKIASCITVTIFISLSFIIKDVVISNLCIMGVLLQTITVTKLLYKIFDVKLGYLEYIKSL